jgi:cohesin complex subunit SA-1/2
LSCFTLNLPSHLFTVIPLAVRKRKRGQSDVETEDERVNTEAESGLSGDEADEEENQGEEEEGEEYRAPSTNGAGVKRKGRAKGSSQGGKLSLAAKRPRTRKTTENKTSKAGGRKSRRPKSADAPLETATAAKTSKIGADNPLFSQYLYIILDIQLMRLNLDAVINPSAALQSTAEDFLESLQQDAGSAQAELINFVLRACGCNDSVNADEVVDYDGVLDALDNFTEGLKKVGYLQLYSCA